MLTMFKRDLCVMFLFTFSEVDESFRARNEQDPHDLYQELVTGRPPQSQGSY